MRLLIVDDEENIRIGLERGLRPDGHTIFTAPDGESALRTVETENPECIITDLKMPGMDGIELTRRIMKKNAEAIVIILTAHGSIESAVDAIKLGAYDYLSKPVDLNDLSSLIHKASEGRRQRTGRTDDTENPLNHMIGDSDEIQNVKQLIGKVASSKASVLILGESGTGKELAAQAIHHNSPRKDTDMVVLNCSALTETLLESELFGHEKGAFTGATRQKAGRFELAHNSTLFLDEIGEIPLPVQVKLLRVLQDHTFERVGGTESIKVDTRIIAATNRDLETAIREGTFREDLYYRLNVLQINLPPLRKRRDDIPLFLDHFLKHFAQENNKIVYGISNKAKHLLMQYPWPGNVRELENSIEAMVIMTSKRELGIDDLPPKIRNYVPDNNAPASELTGGTLKDAEKNLIIDTLQKTDYNRTKTAEILGMGRRTLYRKIIEYGIDIS
jgi:DNA-binding NtrC family response regulator